MTSTDRARLTRELVTLPPGSKPWRAAYGRYRKTEHWKAKKAEQLKRYPFCEMELLMRKRRVRANEVHHRSYAFFAEVIGIDLASVTKANHRMWELRRIRRQRR